MSMSLDGFVGGPNGEADWIFKNMGEDSAAWTLKRISEAGAHLMGSRTYYDMASYWPTSPEPFAAPMNQIPKIIFTTRKQLPPPDVKHTTNTVKDAIDADRRKGIRPLADPQNAESWLHPTVANGDMEEEIRKLKQQDGKPLLAHGGAGFARSLIATGLVDEYQLLIFPVVLSKGLPIFTELKESLNLKLQSSTVFSKGVIGNVYTGAGTFVPG